MKVSARQSVRWSLFVADDVGDVIVLQLGERPRIPRHNAPALHAGNAHSHDLPDLIQGPVIVSLRRPGLFGIVEQLAIAAASH